MNVSEETVLKFGDEMFDMIEKSETHATFQNFSKDGKQRSRSIIFGWSFTIFLLDRRNIGRFPFRWDLTGMQRMIE
jgi:hypothetical protein